MERVYTAAAMAELPEPIVRALAEFPVVTPFARVTLHEAQRHDDRVRARVLVELLAELEVVDVFEQELDICPATPAGVADAVAAVRARAGRPLARRFGLVAEMFTQIVEYRPVAPGNGVRDIADAIYEQALENGFDQRLYVVADWPAPARHVFFLGLANGELGGGGYESFFSRAEAGELVGVLAALDAAGCTGLARLCRLALDFANTQGGIGASDINYGWLAAATAGVTADDDLEWSDIDHHRDDGTYGMVERELPARLAAFVAAHRGELARA